MFKAVSLLFLIVAASARRYEDFGNLIDYGEPSYGGLVLPPYPYHEQQLEPVVVNPLYSEVIVPAVPAVPVLPAVSATKVGFSVLGVVAKAGTFAFGLAKKAVVFLLAKFPALIIGTLAAFGVCKFTPICAKIASIKSIYEVPSELRSFATPERLAKASEFVKTAIRKYRSLQEDEH